MHARLCNASLTSFQERSRPSADAGLRQPPKKQAGRPLRASQLSANDAFKGRCLVPRHKHGWCKTVLRWKSPLRSIPTTATASVAKN